MIDINFAFIGNGNQLIHASYGSFQLKDVNSNKIIVKGRRVLNPGSTDIQDETLHISLQCFPLPTQFCTLDEDVKALDSTCNLNSLRQNFLPHLLEGVPIQVSYG